MWSIFKSPKVPQGYQGGPDDGQIYDYRLGRRFDPGAQAEVFLPTLNNPVYLFRGRARLAGTLSKFQPPQVWFGPQIGTQGLGGVQAGAFVGQPLIDVTEPG